MPQAPSRRRAVPSERQGTARVSPPWGGGCDQRGGGPPEIREIEPDRGASEGEGRFDPTAPDLHLGHAVLLRKMKHFQELGHTVVFLIGDFTGLIGDPTGRSRARPPLSPRKSLRTRKRSRARFSRSSIPSKPSSTSTAGGSASCPPPIGSGSPRRYTVARMLERDDFTKRLKASQPISMHELLYPLAQAYDSVALEADFKSAGPTRRSTILVGRDLREYQAANRRCVMSCRSW